MIGPGGLLPAQSIQHLTDLGNLAGATLAINVAYLSLVRFRYRSQMRECALGQLSPLGPDHKLQASIKNSGQYKDLVYLAHLTDNDGLDEAKKRQVTPGHAPRGGWAWWYRAAFSIHQDLFLCSLMSGLAIFCLLAGIALSINIWSLFKFFGFGLELECVFWVLTIGAFLPAFFVLIGRWVVRAGCCHAISAGKELAALLKDMANQAKAPEQPNLGVRIRIPSSPRAPWAQD